MILQAFDHPVPHMGEESFTTTVHGLLCILRQPGCVEIQSSPGIDLNFARVMARGKESGDLYDFSGGGAGGQLRWINVSSLTEPLEVTVIYKITSYASGNQWVRFIGVSPFEDDDENEDN